MSGPQLPQQRLHTWGEVTKFLGNMWAQAMEADDSAGIDLPEEVSVAIIRIAEDFAELHKLIVKHRASN